MKILVAIFCFFSLAVSAQPKFGVARKDSVPCYQKGADRSKQRYTEWECGKIAGVVDCNQKLEMSQDGKRVVTSSQKMPFSGICETCHMNGILERRVTFVDGFANGVDTTYYKSGCIMVIRSHVQGVENGHWTYFNDSTQIPAWEKNYSMGQFEGPQVTFNAKGDTIKVENYVQGVLNGPKITYDSKGAKSKQVNYVKGLLDGPFIAYNRQGKVIEELSFKQGKKNGVFHYYYDDGVLLRTENWVMDVRNGEFKTLYYDQKLQSVEIYKKGLKEGWFEERFPDEKLKSRALYKKDVLVEEHVFDEQGREIRTFGGTAASGKEDDAMPTTKKKKEKKKKEPKAEPAKEPEKSKEGE